MFACEGLGQAGSCWNNEVLAEVPCWIPGDLLSCICGVSSGVELMVNEYRSEQRVERLLEAVFSAVDDRNKSSGLCFLHRSSACETKGFELPLSRGGRTLPDCLCLFISVFAFQMLGMHLHQKVLPLHSATHAVSQNAYQICFTKYY